MEKFIEMKLPEWEQAFKPVPNNLVKGASFQDEDGQGIMFETYGAEVDFVKSCDPDKVWTYGIGDDGEGYVWNGWHYVNRLGYFVTEVPCPANTTIQVEVK